MKTQLTLIALVASLGVVAQDYTSFTNRLRNLHQTDSSGEKINTAWVEILGEGIPFTHEDSVAFLYRGEARSVAWLGDFNQWGYDKKAVRTGTRIPNTDIWVLKASFPKDARLDYKILIDDSNWILDPNNNAHQWSGVGGGSPNSELRMPAWTPDPLTLERIEGARLGRLEKDLLINSRVLSYQLMYSIYLPEGYQQGQSYPVIYVTDGYEYMHERMGNMATILDNLIHLKKIRPVVAVFIDNREPINRSNNRRMTELAMNERYLSFLTDELMPRIETMYGVSKDPAHRAVLGTSMGGLSAAYFAFAKPGVFGLAGIQSPAFWFRPEIFTLCDNPENPPIKTFMTSGSINDRVEGAQRMKAILDKNTCTYEYREVNQGHSWGNWRDLIDDILVYFFPPPVRTVDR